MPTYQPPLPKAPQPTKIFFDPFNSSATGHQRAENRLSGSTSWRDSRSYKLSHQFRDKTGSGGQSHLSDLVGAGSEHWGKDGRKENGDWEKGAPGLRPKGWQDIRGLMSNTKKRRSDDNDALDHDKKRRNVSKPPQSRPATPSEVQMAQARASQEPSTAATANDAVSIPPQIFRGLTIYLNGSTMPLVSDHRLKQLFAQYGGNASIALGRRTVTHVILGEQGRGGGLAATKIQKENTNVRGKGIKYVSVQWVLDSIEKGIRQPESRYMAATVSTKLGGSGQASVANLFRTSSG